jgi:hypothetical protein
MCFRYFAAGNVLGMFHIEKQLLFQCVHPALIHVSRHSLIDITPEQNVTSRYKELR